MNEIQWYYRENDKVLGPHSANEIQTLYERGMIDNYSYVYDDKTEEWGTMNEKIVLLKSQTSKTLAKAPGVEETLDETEPKTLWQKFQKWNDLDSVPETSLWHDNKNWYWIIIIIVGIVIYRGFFKS